MFINTLTLDSPDYPKLLRGIHNPPVIYHTGADLNNLLALGIDGRAHRAALKVGGKVRPLGMNHWAIF